MKFSRGAVISVLLAAGCMGADARQVSTQQRERDSQSPNHTSLDLFGEQKDRETTRTRRPVPFAEPEFKVISGSVYLSMGFPGVLIPMEGGGATGCLTGDLRTRIELLRTVIVHFPK